MSTDEANAGKAALAAAARAFDRAKKAGHVWLADDGRLHTYEQTGLWRPAEPKNPDQLRLD